MKNLNSNLFTILLLVLSILISDNVLSQSYSLKQPDFVPFYRGTIVSNTKIDIFWDLSEINSNNNRLDLALGLSQFGYTPFPFAEYNYVVGNWYQNENDSNFNEEVFSNRFVNQSANAITGLLFAKLNSNITVKKELILSRTDSKIYVFNNSGGSISTSANQTIHTANGTVAAFGKFTTDDNEDIAVISGSDLKIYKSAGNGSLDTNAVYTLSGVNANKVLISQTSSQIYPYSVVNSTTSDRDEIIIRTGTNIKIYLNDNSNGTSSITTISSIDQFTDFKTADIDNDGYNDLITTSEADGVKIFKNNSGTISGTAFYTNSIQNNSRTIEAADFNKDGWNDFVIVNSGKVYIYLNSYGSFSQTPSDSLDYGNVTSLSGKKIAVADLHNTGGLSVLFSGALAITATTNPYLPNEAPWDDEDLIRFDPQTTDAVPAPAYFFRNVAEQNGVFRPKLLLFNRGDRDFLKYKIYKRSGFTNWEYTLIDSTTNDFYIDTVETLDTTSFPAGIPSYNLFYYVKAEDNSYQLSLNSDTVKYSSIICQTCPNEPLDPDESGDNGIFTVETNETVESDNISPNDYSVNNYPNPFNPVTKINYSIPVSGNVKITVYNSLGKVVYELLNEFKDKGNYNIQFDGINLASGIYYYRIESGSFTQVRKMILLK